MASTRGSHVSQATEGADGWAVTVNRENMESRAVIEHGGHQIHEVLDRADKCLYEAKRGGRNCTVFEEVGKIDPDKYKESARANFDDEGGFAGESAAH